MDCSDFKILDIRKVEFGDAFFKSVVYEAKKSERLERGCLAINDFTFIFFNLVEGKYQPDILVKFMKDRSKLSAEDLNNIKLVLEEKSLPLSDSDLTGLKTLYSREFRSSKLKLGFIVGQSSLNNSDTDEGWIVQDFSMVPTDSSQADELMLRLSEITSHKKTKIHVRGDRRYVKLFHVKGKSSFVLEIVTSYRDTLKRATLIQALVDYHDEYGTGTLDKDVWSRFLLSVYISCSLTDLAIDEDVRAQLNESREWLKDRLKPNPFTSIFSLSGISNENR